MPPTPIDATAHLHGSASGSRVSRWVVILFIFFFKLRGPGLNLITAEMGLPKLQKGHPFFYKLFSVAEGKLGAHIIPIESIKQRSTCSNFF